MSYNDHVRGQTLHSNKTVSVTFASGSPTSNAFAMPHHGIGHFWLPSGFTGFGLSLQVAPSADGTFAGLTDNSNAYGTDVNSVLPTAQLVAPFAGITPPYWFGTNYGKLWSTNGSGSGIPQDSARVCVMVIKG